MIGDDLIKLESPVEYVMMQRKQSIWLTALNINLLYKCIPLVSWNMSCFILK